MYWLFDGNNKPRSTESITELLKYNGIAAYSVVHGIWYIRKKTPDTGKHYWDNVDVSTVPAEYKAYMLLLN